MDWVTLLALVKKLGKKLPQAWPHIANIISETKAVLVIMAEPELFGASPEAEEFVAVCIANGVSEANARDALAH